MKPLLLLLAALALPANAADELFGPYTISSYRVIDGDTLDVNLTLWPGLTQRTAVRLAGINTPEKRPPACSTGDLLCTTRRNCEIQAAANATAFTEKWLGKPGKLTLSNVHRDKYGGRVLGDITNSEGEDLGVALVDAGHGKLYQGGKRGPWCDLRDFTANKGLRNAVSSEGEGENQGVRLFGCIQVAGCRVKTP